MTAEPVVVRILTEADLDLLLGADRDVFDNPVDPAQAEAFLGDPRHHLAAAIGGGQLVGMASGVHYLHPDKPTELWINELGVAGPWRRRGVGRRLIEVLVAHGRSLGCEEAWVLTERENRPAMALYEAAGGTESAGDTVMFEWGPAE